METKICKKCGKELPVDKFYKNKSQKDGFGYYFDILPPLK